MTDVGQIASGVSVVVFGGGAVLGLLRLSLAGTFATRKAHQDLVARVDTVEDRVSRSPRYSDLSAMGERLAQVEKGVAAQAATLAGVAESVGSVERLLRLLLEAQLQKDKGAT